MASKKDRTREARRLLKTARGQWEDAAVDSWEPVDAAGCVTKCFYGFENALTAAVIALGEKRTKIHFEKAELATKLAKSGKLTTDISGRLVELNDLGKDVQYGEPGANLANTDLEGRVGGHPPFHRRCVTTSSSDSG